MHLRPAAHLCIISPMPVRRRSPKWLRTVLWIAVQLVVTFVLLELALRLIRPHNAALNNLLYLPSVSTNFSRTATTTELLTTEKKDPSFDYSLVLVDSRVVSILSKQRLSFGAAFRNRARYVPKNVLRPGDTVAVTIYETGGSSLFPPPYRNIFLSTARRAASSRVMMPRWTSASSAWSSVCMPAF